MTLSSLKYSSTLLILLLIVSFIIVPILSTVCLKDRTIFPDADEDQDVQWYLILKLPSYSNLYLYFDSDMADEGETRFAVGYFLRSSQSALAATLLNIENNPFEKFVFNDQNTNNVVRPLRGIHQKGILSYVPGSEDDIHSGIFIDHSFPYFPIPTSFEPYDVDLDLSNPTLGEIAKHTYLGWDRPFYPSNIENNAPNPSENEDDFFSFTREFNQDYANVPGHSTTYAQHFFCHRYEDTILFQTIRNYVEQGTNFGLLVNENHIISGTNIWDLLEGEWFITTFGQIPDNDIPQYIDKAHHDNVCTCRRTNGCNFQVQQTCPVGNEIPFFGTYPPIFESRPHLTPAIFQFQISSGATFQQFNWGMGMGPRGDHSKFAFRVEAAEEGEFSFCVGGGNLGQPHSSIMTCIEDENLRTALSNLLNEELMDEMATSVQGQLPCTTCGIFDRTSCEMKAMKCRAERIGQGLNYGVKRTESFGRSALAFRTLSPYDIFLTALVESQINPVVENRMLPLTERNEIKTRALEAPWYDNNNNVLDRTQNPAALRIEVQRRTRGVDDFILMILGDYLLRSQHQFNQDQRQAIVQTKRNQFPDNSHLVWTSVFGNQAPPPAVQMDTD